jgi:restriction system protein
MGKGNPIGRPMIQQFAGALAGKGASKGVFITTSSFSAQAIEFAKQVPQRPVLIDGEKLTKLMIQYGVGVSIERTVEIKRIDLDYFEESEERIRRFQGVLFGSVTNTIYSICYLPQ